MNKTILIIEDEPSIADNIVYALKAEGFTCLWDNLASAGITRLSQEKIDLLILDVGLPDKSGFDACKEIRAFSDIPIIFLSARSDEIDRVVGFEIGADDYVTKPFSPRELVARVKVRINKHASLSSSKFTRENSNLSFSLDDSKKKILFKNKTLNLTTFEFKILSHLINNPEHVFSRDQLLAVVRDMPEVALDRSIDTHIKSLRAKIHDIDSQENPIKTHRGLGYSLSIEL